MNIPKTFCVYFCYNRGLPSDLNTVTNMRVRVSVQINRRSGVLVVPGNREGGTVFSQDGSR